MEDIATGSHKRSENIHPALPSSSRNCNAHCASKALLGASRTAQTITAVAIAVMMAEITVIAELYASRIEILGTKP